MMTQEHAFCLNIEYLLNVQHKVKSINFTRILFDELTRILNHMLAIACHALDIGSMSSIFWAFEERELIMEFYERVSGARMHAAFHRSYSNFSYVLDKDLLKDILLFIKNCYKTLNEMHNVLTYNKIWKQRLLNIGSLTPQNVLSWGLTGVLSRSVGLKKDLRLSLSHSYSNYLDINVKSFLGVNGDCFDRYLIRMLEMAESLKIVNYLCNFFLNNPSFTNLSYQQLFTFSLKNNSKNVYMENIIEHFLQWHTGLTINSGLSTIYIESPKGEFGTILTSNNSNKPQKCKIRSPSYFSLQALPLMTKGHYLADLAALIGTIDIVFGEIDR